MQPVNRCLTNVVNIYKHIYIYVDFCATVAVATCMNLKLTLSRRGRDIATWPCRDNACSAQMILNVMKCAEKFKPAKLCKVTLQGLSWLQNCRYVRNDRPLAPSSGVINIYCPLRSESTHARAHACICCNNIFSTFEGYGANLSGLQCV